MRELLALVVANVGRRWQERRDEQRLDRQTLVVEIEERFTDGGISTMPVRRAWRWTAATRRRDHNPIVWLLRVDAWRRRN